MTKCEIFPITMAKQGLVIMYYNLKREQGDNVWGLNKDKCFKEKINSMMSSF